MAPYNFCMTPPKHHGQRRQSRSLIGRDRMQYFAKDGPLTRLVALVVCMLPLIISSLAGAGVVLAKALGW